MREHMVLISSQADQALRVASVDNLVEIDDSFIVLGHPFKHKIHADVANFVSNENFCFFAQCAFPTRGTTGQYFKW